MKYIYRCADCDTSWEEEHSIAECDTLTIHCQDCNRPAIRAIQPVMHVGEKVKPKTKHVKAIREHSQQLALDKKRGLR